MLITETTFVGRKARSVEVPDTLAIKLTQNIDASGKALYIGQNMFDALLREIPSLRPQVKND